MQTNNSSHSFVISNNPQEELYRVLSALSTVFNTATAPHRPDAGDTTDLSNRDDADRYLTQFQRSSVAWIVANRLLSMSNDPQVQFFAAQTLHTKCRADILQLESQQQMNSLRDSLMDYLVKCISHGGSGNKAIVTRLAMTICCLALQMKWESIMDDLLMTLQQQSQQQQQQQIMVELVLVIAKILPEEVHSERVLLPNEQQRLLFIDKLVHSVENMLQFLFFCASNAGGDDVLGRVKIQEQVLRCLHSWVRYVNIPPSLLQTTQLLDFTFAILQANDYNAYGGDLFELSVDVVIEILRCYPSDNPANMGLVQKLIPLIMDLGGESHSPFQKALRLEDEDSLRDYCRIFTEMGESYMSLIVHHEDLNQVKLVNLVLACSAIPDNDIATITLHFWYRFVSCLEDTEPYEYRQLQIDNYTPQIIKLVSTCISLLRYPSDIDELSGDRIDDIDRNRFYVNDTLEDCCRLLGGDMVLRTIGELLQKEVERLSSLGEEGLKQWHTIEACVKALISTSRYIPHDESAVLPFVMNLVPNLPTSVRFLRKTANLMVGAFAEWLNRHYNQLQPILPFLSQGLSDTASASSAAVAIKQLCENSNSHVALGDSVLHLYDGIVAAQLQQQQHSSTSVPVAPILDIRDELEVLEGACKAVSRQLQENLVQDPTSSSSLDYINRIVEPIGARLVQYSSSTKTGPKQVIAELERLTVVIRHLNIPNRREEFLIDLMTQCWPYLEMISTSFTDFQMAEKVCRLHKHCLRNCGVSTYQPLFEKLCIHLVNNFTHSRQSPYLYAASIVITEFGKNADTHCQKQLYAMLEEMGKVSFQLLHSTDQFKNHPDVVEELFFLASRMIQYCPEIFVSSHMFHPFVQCATVGMTQHHKDANRGSMTFLDHAFSFALTIQSCSTAGCDIGGSILDCKQSIEALLSKEGQAIVTNLILSLIGDLPCYRISSNNGSVAGVLYKIYQLCPALVMEWISVPLNRVSKTEQTLLMSAFQSNVSKDELFSVCERFVEVCSRSQRMGSAF
mmetsp:Transcript_833/g.1438  ORF Transcript_833/g.1438 Transcript_833/m.1438 type:complete len:1018 (+) Transcript_833:1952-5005(+)|eukprot:CAMPEP_0176496194 /NCGR_PEP_ID=MMETSP0200_2-20121128/11067_1 /TAXON_ID=947934 /ORGANISM="Chaetoceros sp., Strain GSL56" /LENGTH=1017 /DNA_ID=CAMNT_0017894137 /DNA_START=2460 /DNA_END=5513 /DNA_ORIENTATION=-